MPEFIVSQTASEYAAYSKKKRREAITAGILSMIIALLMCSITYSILWAITHVN